MRAAIGPFLLLFVMAAQAAFVTHEELCTQGNKHSCELVELGKRIDSDALFGPQGKYRLAVDDRYIPQSGGYFDITVRARYRALITCGVSARAYVNADVERFARIQSATVVDRAEYDACIPIAQNNYRRTYTRDLMSAAAKFVLAPMIALGALIALFWYRRPVARGVRRAKDKLNDLGAD